MCHRMHFLDLQQLDRWLNSCMHLSLNTMPVLRNLSNECATQWTLKISLSIIRLVVVL